MLHTWVHQCPVSPLCQSIHGIENYGRLPNIDDIMRLFLTSKKQLISTKNTVTRQVEEIEDDIEKFKRQSKLMKIGTTRHFDHPARIRSKQTDISIW